MTSTSKTIVFFGTDDFSAQSLHALLTEGAHIGAVVTKPDSRKGRGRALVFSAVKRIALEHDIPVLQPTKVAEITPFIEQLTDSDGAAPVGVLVSYGRIIPQSVIDLFQPGIINVHPSLLPRYRGPSPVESAILNGDSETGVTIMQLSAAMDAGPLYSQITAPLDGTETTPQLETELGEAGAAELCRVLPAIIDGSLQLTPQDDDAATYCQLLRKEDGILTPEIHTAEEAERRIRAYLAFPKTKTTLLGQSIVITKAHVAESATTPLDIACVGGTFLSVDGLIGPSGKPMNANAFLNGYGSRG